VTSKATSTSREEEREKEKYSSVQWARKIKIVSSLFNEGEGERTIVVKAVMMVRSMKSVRVCLLHVSATHCVYVCVYMSVRVKEREHRE
jgi:hypothetical protein